MVTAAQIQANPSLIRSRSDAMELTPQQQALFSHWVNTVNNGQMAHYSAPEAKPAARPAGGPPAKSTPLSSADASAKDIINSFLTQYDLGSLASWAWSRYKQSNSVDVVKIEMRDRPEYKTRFAGLLQLAQKGVAITEQQQIDWERQASDIMRQAGMPSGFYDNWKDFQDMIGKGWSTSELSNRVNNAYARVANAPAAIRNTFAEYYGASGDTNLAATFLDSGKALPILQNQAAAAEIGGLLSQQGVKINRDLAEASAKFGGDAASNQRNAAQVGAMQAAGLFDRQLGETADVSSQTGVEAAFQQNAAAQTEVNRKISGREAMTGGAGGALTTQQGVVGLGTERP